METFNLPTYLNLYPIGIRFFQTEHAYLCTPGQTLKGKKCCVMGWIGCPIFVEAQKAIVT